MGDATSTFVNTPTEQTSCHRPSTTSGPMTRRAMRGSRSFRWRLFCWSGRVSVMPGTASRTTGETPTGRTSTSRPLSRSVAAMGSSVRRGGEDGGGNEGNTFDQLGLAPVGPDGDLADQGHPVQHPIHVEMAEILGSEVGGRPVVPEGDAPRLPAEAHRVLGPGDLGEEVLQDPPALQRLDVDDVVNKPGADEQGPFTGPRVHADDRVDGDEGVLLDALSVSAARLARVAGAVAVLGPQRVDEGPDRRGQALVGCHQIGEGGVTAVAGNHVGAQDR